MHVDYGDDMHTQLTKKFIEENGVRFLIQVEDKGVRFTDRYGYLQSSELNTFYSDFSKFLSDFKIKKGEKVAEGSNIKL